MVNRGINRAGIFCDQGDYEHLMGLLAKVSQRYAFEVHGYVLMDNHYHLIVRVPEGNLSRGMQWLNVSYSIWFNRRHDRVGPLFQGRFKSVPVEGGGWLYRLSQYVHLNPVRVKWLGLDKQGRRLEGLGMKQAASAAEAASRLKVLREHGWSSCRACAVYSRGAEWLHQETILARAGGRGGAERRGLAPGRPIANLAPQWEAWIMLRLAKRCGVWNPNARLIGTSARPAVRF